MASVAWSRCDGEDCIRVGGVAPGADVRVRPAASAIDRPAMAGRVKQVDDGAVCFVPRFPFVAGTAYAVAVDGRVVGVLDRPAVRGPATTDVVAAHPGGELVPRNLLRFSLSFSAPMREGGVAAHVRLVDDDAEGGGGGGDRGAELVGALLANERELWDPDRRRLTVLLDPARIKRGLVGHRELGYPLRAGRAFRLVVDEDLLDAAGRPLRHGFERRYVVGDDERGRIDPHRWELAPPAASTTEPVVVSFDRPLDHALLSRCLTVLDADGRSVDGTATIAVDQRAWALRPGRPWSGGTHRLVVDPVLEDLAGNSVQRVFDRDLARAEDDPGDGRPVVLDFTPR